MYEHFSNTTSGWSISTDPDAAPEKRWRAVHDQFGEKFFAEHEDILKFTVSHMRDRFYEQVTPFDAREELLRFIKRGMQ
jgi:hypothetical protein